MKKHYKVIACNVMWREVCYYAALSPNSFRLEFLSWGLHTEPDKLRVALQRSIDATEDGFDAIILGYGLCSNGVDGIVARRTRLVITRGHDCMTCFLGSKERYREYFDANPGTYWYTPGWIENHLAPGQERYEKTHQLKQASNHGVQATLDSAPDSGRSGPDEYRLHGNGLLYSIVARWRITHAGGDTTRQDDGRGQASRTGRHLERPPAHAG